MKKHIKKTLSIAMNCNTEAMLLKLYTRIQHLAKTRNGLGQFTTRLIFITNSGTLQSAVHPQNTVIVAPLFANYCQFPTMVSFCANRFHQCTAL